MKLFIKRFLIAVLPVAIIAWPLDIFISKNLSKSNDFAQKEFSVWNDLYSGKVDADLLIYGSSRAWVQINPMRIQKETGLKSYNLGVDGHNFWLQNIRHNLILSANKKPKLIVHSLDIFTFQKREDLYNSDQFLPYMLFNHSLKQQIEGYKGFRIYDSYVPLLRYTGNLNAIKAAFKMSLKNNPQSNPKQRILGFQSRNQQWNDDFEKAKKEKGKITIKFDKATLKLYDQFLSDCEKRNIEVVLIYTPEYIEGQQFVTNRKELFNIINKIKNKHHLTFIDYSKDSLCFDKKYFYNATHLNTLGSDIISTKIGKDLVRLGFLRN
jgi:hypothetical protein